jgi:hypothetical protein
MISPAVWVVNNSGWLQNTNREADEVRRELLYTHACIVCSENHTNAARTHKLNTTARGLILWMNLVCEAREWLPACKGHGKAVECAICCVVCLVGVGPCTALIKMPMLTVGLQHIT